MTELADLWQTLSRKIQASVLVDDGAILAIQDILGKHAEWFTPKERIIWRGIQACIEANIPPTVEAVTQRTNGGLPSGYIQTIANQFNDDDNRRLIYLAEQLRDVGVLAAIREQGRTLAELDDPEGATERASRVTTELGGLLAERSNRSADAVAVSDAAWADVNHIGGTGVPTGIKWLDELTGGMWAGHNWWVVAPYKSGKSTIVRNIVLSAASAGHPTGMFCAEGSREMFALDCQAMLATELLIERGYQGKLRLSGMFIRRVYWKQGILNHHELDAIHDAKDIWEKLPILIWDTRDGIRDLVTLRYLVKMAKLKTQASIFWADYSQLFGTGKTIYDRQSHTSLAIQDIAQDENVLFGMVAQQNEEHIKFGNKSWSPGVKGGGDAAAAADVLLIPKIDPEQPDYLHLVLKLSRHTGMGGDGLHKIIRSCGLIDKRVDVSVGGESV